MAPMDADGTGTDGTTKDTKHTKAEFANSSVASDPPFVSFVVQLFAFRRSKSPVEIGGGAAYNGSDAS